MDIVADGKTRVCWVPDLNTPGLPTVAELNAGFDLEDWLTADGLSLNFSNDEVDTTALSSTFGSKLPGRQSVEAELTLKDQGRGVAPWSTFAGRPFAFMVVRRNVDVGDNWAAADEVEVYPCQAGTRRPLPPAANEVAKFAVSMFFDSQPYLDAMVA